MTGYKIGEQVYIGENLIIIEELDDKRRVKIWERITFVERVIPIISSFMVVAYGSRIYNSKTYKKDRH